MHQKLEKFGLTDIEKKKLHQWLKDGHTCNKDDVVIKFTNIGARATCDCPKSINLSIGIIP